MQLARVLTVEGPRVVLAEPDLHHGRAATVDGRAFADLPDLLEASGGDADRIRPGADVGFVPTDLLSVVGRPRKIICIGLNYASHAAEGGGRAPRHPILFPKWDNALTGPYDDVPLPPESSFVDWEAELAFVIGRSCRRARPAEADAVVFGFTAANDLSMRDFQRKSPQWAPGKAWDAGTAVGPTLVDTASLGSAAPDLALIGRHNGVVVQRCRTSELIFSVPELVEYISMIMTLEPGDLVLTGTPAGVAMAAGEGATGLRPGDTYEVEIASIGAIRNRFIAEADWTSRRSWPT